MGLVSCMEFFEPNPGILPSSQQSLWPELKDTPQCFVLYGGTAIALRLGHRQSIDFDFFADCQIDPQQLLREIPYLRGAIINQIAPNILSVSIDRDGMIRLSFFGVPSLKRIKMSDRTAIAGIRIASLLDLAGTKVSVVQKRAEARDYIDIDAIMTKGGITLPEALAAGKVIYGDQFNPQITLKALSYYDEPGLSELPDIVRSHLLTAVQQVDLDLLPILDCVADSKSKGWT